LSETQRWDVLTYVHRQFHGGFPETVSHDAKPHGDKDKGQGHESSGHSR